MNKHDICEAYEKMMAEKNGYKQGVESEHKKRIEQLQYIRNKIKDIMSVESILFFPLADLYNEIGLMQNDLWEE